MSQAQQSQPTGSGLLDELLYAEDAAFVKKKDQCYTRGFFKGIGFMFLSCTGVGFYLNYKELTTRTRVKFMYLIPITVGGALSFLYCRNNYHKCETEFWKDYDDYHKARNYAPFPAFRANMTENTSSSTS